MRSTTGLYPTTTCPKNSGSEKFGGPIYRPAKRPGRAIVVKTVDVTPSKRQRVGSSKNAKLLKQQGKPHRVSTGDPLGPSQMITSCKSSLLSTTYGSMGWRWPVEACGALLKLEAPDSYKIIYTSPKPFGITGVAHLRNLPRAPAKGTGNGNPRCRLLSISFLSTSRKVC